ncbi:MAG: MoaD/ThiS family protein [Methanimicrococcus sp.]|nr:MoaD/ThiS family protein [Methanimicrococcus sp.]
MIITISAFGSFKNYFGENVKVELSEETNLKGVLADMAAQYPAGLELLFDKDGSIRRHLIIQVNKKRIAASKAEEVILKDGDEVVVYPPVSGG